MSRNRYSHKFRFHNHIFILGFFKTQQSPIRKKKNSVEKCVVMFVDAAWLRRTGPTLTTQLKLSFSVDPSSNLGYACKWPTGLPQAVGIEKNSKQNKKSPLRLFEIF